MYVSFGKFTRNELTHGQKAVQNPGYREKASIDPS